MTTRNNSQLFYNPKSQQPFQIFNQLTLATSNPMSESSLRLQFSQQQLKGYKKTARQAESAAFLCQLVYFGVKSCTILMFYNWKTPLNDSIMRVVWFVGLLVVNSYFMLMSGRNPGFETRKINKKQEEILLEQYKLVKAKQSQSISYVRAQQQQNSQLLNQSHSKQQHNQPQQQSSLISDTQPQHSPSLSDQISTSVSQCIPCPQKSNSTESQQFFSRISIQNYCKICNCLKRNRMKHCYSCGKCVMKYDHHCPWIGSCVGEQNHFMFLLCLLFHTLQSVTTFYICIKALDEYKYYDQQNDTFSTQFGVLVLWCFFMCFYIVFAGCLLFFHLYLVSANITTRQLMSRRKCEYLREVKGNPYDEGILRNLQYAICPDQNGREWIVSETLSSQNREKSWYQKIWKNQYYDCC